LLSIIQNNVAAENISFKSKSGSTST